MIDYETYIGQIRALIGDTDEEALDMSDEQIESYYQMSYNNIVQASIMALRALIAKYSKESGDVYRLDTIEYESSKSRANHFQALLNNLEQSIKDGTNPLLCGIPKTFGIYQYERKENYERMRNGEIIPPKTSDYEYDLIRRKTQYGPYEE